MKIIKHLTLIIFASSFFFLVSQAAVTMPFSSTGVETIQPKDSPSTPQNLSNFQANASSSKVDKYSFDSKTANSHSKTETTGVISNFETNSVNKTCIVAGCNGALCTDTDSGLFYTTCMYRPEFQCYLSEVCEVQSDGNCGWTETEKLNQCLNSFSDLKAFPSAQGFGANSIGGRMGTIIRVTNLNDSGIGSFRYALESLGPRIIVFEVGGIITLQTDINIENPYITVAGQTAPGSGITLKDFGLAIKTHDVIIRNLRVRVGDQGNIQDSPGSRDGIRISTTSAITDVHDVIIDNCSVSWAIDENISTWKDSSNEKELYNVTFQNNIISEALYNSIHPEGLHSMGMLIGSYGTENITIFNNIFSQNDDRNPRISGALNTEVINNVIYGWDSGPAKIGGDPTTSNITNNYFKPADFSRDDELLISDTMDINSQIYIDGNITNEIGAGITPISIRNNSGFIFENSPVHQTEVPMMSAESAYTHVIANAGVTTPARDSIDTQIISNVENRTGSIIDTPPVNWWNSSEYATSSRVVVDSDDDYIPDDWELSHGMNPNDPSDVLQVSSSGYMRIEEYINSLLD